MTPRRTAPATQETPVAKHRTELLRTMLLIRRFEEACAELYSATKIRGFLHLYVGEEAVATGVMSALGADDAVVSTYREHGHALARGVAVESLMAEMFGRETGCSRGRGGSMHIFDRATNFVGGNAVVGGGIPLAVGLALADKMQGRNRVTVCFFGDGADGRGRVPRVAEPGRAVAVAGAVLLREQPVRHGHGTEEGARPDRPRPACRVRTALASWPVDGMDVLAVEDAARRAVEEIRGGAGPHFLELRTYRFRAHSMYDPDRYRDKAEVQSWRQHDPIDALCELMRAEGQLDDDGLARLEAEISDEIAHAVEAADRAPIEPVEDADPLRLLRER